MTVPRFYLEDPAPVCGACGQSMEDKDVCPSCGVKAADLVPDNECRTAEFRYLENVILNSIDITKGWYRGTH